jgi:hypothetical protein
MSDWNAFRRDLDGGRMPVNVGMARVESEGGLRRAGRGIPLFLGLLGRPGPREVLRDAGVDSGVLAFTKDS